jgi:hypothetical protein
MVSGMAMARMLVVVVAEARAVTGKN